MVNRIFRKRDCGDHCDTFASLHYSLIFQIAQEIKMAVHLETDAQLLELKFQLEKGGARALKANYFVM